jgi:H+/Na+-translocating ferredoxin:NAD+ oxidoreductase subunit B
MNDGVYRKLAKVLDTLPNGFPATEPGIEIKILKRIFAPEEADLFCDLRLTAETAEQIAKRTGRPLEGLEEMLTSMRERGEISGAVSGGVKKFKMIPWVIGIWEFQLNRMDREFAEMCKEYSKYWGKQFVSHGPAMMQVIPIEREISVKQEALSYERVSGIIESARSFLVNECVCKKNQGILGSPCDRPHEVCMGLSPEPGFFESHSWGGKVITKTQAYEVLKLAEEAGLVHLTNKTESDHWFICNCCGCCCGVLKGAKMGAPNLINSHYYAQIDPDLCEACGICAEERCQVRAIEAGEDAHRVIKEKCIGCGLCISTCPTEAIELIRKQPEEMILPVKNEEAWMEERARQRGVDFSRFK